MRERCACDERRVAGADASPADRLTEAVQRLQQVHGLELRLDEPMAPHTSLAVGGAAAVFAIPRTVEAVCEALEVSHSLRVPLMCVGRGTNLLVREGGFPGILLHIGEALSAIEVGGRRMTVQSGATLAEACDAAAAAGLSGLEFAAGVPGSVGGAVAMNAGTGTGQIGDVVEAVEVVREDGSLRRCRHDSLKFGYRRSCLQGSKCIVVAVVFALTEAEPTAIRKAMFEAVESRCRKQPLSKGSCGSVFKRPPNDYAGRLLELAGVKGLQIGGARFSPKHANFIVNEGNATARDVVDLIEAAKRRVYEVTGVMLEEEVCVVGEPLPPQ